MNEFYLIAILGCGVGTLLWVAWFFSKSDDIKPGEKMNTNNEIELSTDIISLLEKEAALKKRTIDEQVNHWIKLGRITELEKKTATP